LQPERIAIFCPNWVGDVVMATPALAALRRQYPRARITGVLRPYVAGVLEGGDWFDETLPGKGIVGTAWKLRPRKIDLAVLFTNSFRTAAAAWFGGCKRTIGYARDWRSVFLTDRLEPPRDVQGRFLPSPIIDAYNLLAVKAGCPLPGHRMTLHTTAADEAAADAVWAGFRLDHAERVIALNPGAAYGAAKHWPITHFVELARRCVDELRAAVLVLCGPNERDLAARIAHEANRPTVHSLAATPVTLGLIKACVRRVDLLVTTDSGPRHFAAAFDRPVVTLFGPTHIAWTETYFAKAVHLQKQVPCGPCQLRVCPLDHRCMKTLGPDEAFAAAAGLLHRCAGDSLRSRHAWEAKRDARRAS
jgi:heptosyltransferase-2